MSPSRVFGIVAGVLVLLGTAWAAPASAQYSTVSNPTYLNYVYEAYYWGVYSSERAAHVELIADVYGFTNEYVTGAVYNLNYATVCTIYGYYTGSPVAMYLAYVYALTSKYYEAGIRDYAINTLEPQLGQYAGIQGVVDALNDFKQSANDAAQGADYMANYSYYAAVIAYVTLNP